MQDDITIGKLRFCESPVVGEEGTKTWLCRIRLGVFDADLCVVRKSWVCHPKLFWGEQSLELDGEDTPEDAAEAAVAELRSMAEELMKLTEGVRK